MQGLLAQHGLDRRFLELTAFMMIGTWVCLAVLTMGLVILGWKIILFHQVVAWPFALMGWMLGFRLAHAMGLMQRAAALFAGLAALGLAEIGVTQVVNLWSGTGGQLGGLIALPILLVLVVIGVLWLYRAETWQQGHADTVERTKA